MSDVATDLKAALIRAPFDGLDDEARHALATAATVRSAGVGESLQPARDDDALVIVLEGAAEVLDITAGTPTSVMRQLGPGSAYDRRQLLAFGEDLIAVASEPTTYALVPAAVTDELLVRGTGARGTLRRLHRRTMLCRLHGLLGAVDEDFLDRLEDMAFWQSLPRGAEMPIRSVLPDLFLVVSGRVRILNDAADGSSYALGEAALGESVTEDAFFGVETPPGRVVAVRDSVLVGFSPEEFDAIVQLRPDVLRRVTRSLVQRFRQPARRASAAPITNVAVVPLLSPEGSEAFVNRLEHALAQHGTLLRLGAADVDRHLGVPDIAQADDSADAEHLAAWLDAREQDHRFLLYIADRNATAWTRRCLRQADRILLVADFTSDPRPESAEREMLAYTERLTGAFETLVLVHPDGSHLPRGTRRWLEARNVESHVHVRWDRDGDIQRLARELAGRSIGVALGGGGARGFAHIGTLRAFAEAGIPIDRIAGTSMGANIAAQYAMGWSPNYMLKANRRIWIDLAPHRRYTLPVISVLGDRRAQACARLMYDEFDIEDTWIPFFCISSDLSAASAVIHEHGVLRRAVTASSSLPGVAVPVLHNGHLLVDGGLLDNLPAKVLREIGCGVVIAAEVTVEEDEIFAVDHVPGTWQALRTRMQRRAPRDFPTIGDLALRAVMLNSANHQREALEAADLSLHPPVDKYRLMDFPALDELHAIGADHARDRIAQWQADPSVAQRLTLS